MNNRVNSVNTQTIEKLMSALGNTEPTVSRNVGGGVTTGAKRQIAVRPDRFGNETSHPRHPERVVIQSELCGNVETVLETTRRQGQKISERLAGLTLCELQELYDYCYANKWSVCRSLVGCRAFAELLPFEVSSLVIRSYLVDRGVVLSGNDARYVDAKRNDKIASRLRDHFSDEENAKQMRERARTAYQANKTKIQAAVNKGVQTFWSSERGADKARRHSSIMKERWATLPEDTARSIIAKSMDRRKKPVVEAIDGRTIQFDSPWEPSMYRLLRRFGVPFRYTNEVSDKNFTPLAQRRWWFPDFVLDDAIVEVKGTAYLDAFLMHRVPLIIEARLKKPVYICPFNVDERQYHDFDSLKADMILVGNSDWTSTSSATSRSRTRRLSA